MEKKVEFKNEKYEKRNKILEISYINERIDDFMEWSPSCLINSSSDCPDHRKQCEVTENIIDFFGYFFLFIFIFSDPCVQQIKLCINYIHVAFMDLECTVSQSPREDRIDHPEKDTREGFWWFH